MGKDYIKCKDAYHDFTTLGKEYKINGVMIDYYRITGDHGKPIDVSSSKFSASYAKEIASPSKEQILEAAKTSTEVKEWLKTLFPDFFEEDIDAKELEHVIKDMRIITTSINIRSIYLPGKYTYRLDKDTFNNTILIPKRK